MTNDPNQPGYPNDPAYPPYQPPSGYGPGQPYDPNAAPGAYAAQPGDPYGSPPYASYGAPPPRKGSAVPWVIGGCLGLLLLVGAVIVLLAVIGARPGPPTAVAPTDATATTAPPAATATDAAAPSTATAASGAAVDVPGGLQRAADNMQSRLPLIFGDLTVTSATANGTSLDLEGTVTENMQNGWDDFNTGMRRGLCSSGFGDAIRAGGVLRLTVTDSAGNNEMLFVRDC